MIMIRLRIQCKRKFAIRLNYDYFVNNIHDYDYDCSVFVIDYNPLRLRDYNYSKSATDLTTRRENKKRTKRSFSKLNIQLDL